jgi:acyl carrier protein
MDDPEALINMSAVISPKAYPQSDIDTILTELRQILVNDLNVSVPLERIDASSSLQDLNMDSVAMIELISAVEARFDFTFADSDLVLGSFASLRALSEVIFRRIHASTRV